MYDALKLIGHWPLETEDARKEKLHVHIPPEKALKLIHGADNQTKVSLFVSNEQCHIGVHTIPGGKMTDSETHEGDEALLVLDGKIQVSVIESEADEKGVSRGCWVAQKGDAFLIPEGMKHQYFNLSKGVARFLFAIAPKI
jgi:quercetin dioxygenase-like cupin family protein